MPPASGRFMGWLRLNFCLMFLLYADAYNESHYVHLQRRLHHNCPVWGDKYVQMQEALSKARLPPSAPSMQETIDVAMTVLTDRSNDRWPMSQFLNFKVAVTSILFETTSRVAFHIITTNEWFSMLERFFVDLSASVLNFCFRLYCVDLRAMGVLMSQMSFHAPEALFSRVMLPTMLLEVDDLIYLDTDLFIVTDLEHLWRQRLSMGSKALAAVPTGSDYSGRYCSCVMLLRLEILRKLGGVSTSDSNATNWLHTIKHVVHSSSEFQTRKVAVPEILFVEQKIYSWLGIHFNLVQPIPTGWNVQQCTSKNRQYQSALASNKFLGIVHFNCMGNAQPEHGKFASMTPSANASARHVSAREQDFDTTRTTYAPFYSFYQALPTQCLSYTFNKVPQPPAHDDGLPTLANAVCGESRKTLGCRPYTGT